jgi:tyrosine-protein phosphatase SIW14
MKTLSRTSLLLIVGLFSFTGSLASAQAIPALTQAQSTIGNFQTFGGNLYRGARPSSEDDLKTLKKLGVKTVIDLQGGDIKDNNFGMIAGLMEPGESPDWIAFERKTAEGLGMKFINLPLNSLAPIDDYETGRAIGNILRVINDPKNQPVYVHCEHGKDRTGLVVALYRVYFQNWLKAKAHDEMLKLGHNTFFTGDMDRFFYAVTADKK